MKTYIKRSLKSAVLLSAMNALEGIGTRSGWAQPSHENRWRSNHPHWRGFWMPHSGAKECARRQSQ